MKQTTFFLLALFVLSSCHLQPLPQKQPNDCMISAAEVLSCIASSANLTDKEVSAKFDSIKNINTVKENPAPTSLSKLLCLSLHDNAPINQRQQGEKILQKILQKPECNDQTLSGLLLITQSNIDLYTKYLNTNWTSYLKNKKSYKEQDTFIKQLESEALSYKRRIQDLEQQVQKLKEIETMLDTKTTP